MKKIIFIITWIIIIAIAYWKESSFDSYEKYNDRNKKLCTNKEIYIPNQKLYNTEQYSKLIPWEEGPLEEKIKELNKKYTENMNNIYKCSMIHTQIQSLYTIQSLIENNTVLKKSIENNLKTKIQELKENEKATNCIASHWENEKQNTKKKDVLKQTTQELCSYHSYLQYTKEFYQDLRNRKDENIDIAILQKENTQTEKLIQIEIDNAYEIFPLAYNTYVEYENNLQIHNLLLLLKQEYYLYRENLHSAINPINQVIYKISNSMEK